jgi:serine protease Do
MTQGNKIAMSVAYTLIAGIAVGTGACITVLLLHQRSLEERVDALTSAPSSGVTAVSGPPVVVEKIVSSGQLWRPVQELVRDTVVQVFSHISATDLLRPYVPPAQGSSTGSGFFINDQGDLVTNAHVVNQAESIWIQIPSLGKRIIDVDFVGFCPERDLALLRVRPEGLEIIRRELGAIPYLLLGDSDLVLRSDEVLALGYPLGQQMLKSTTGVVSGREQMRVQTFIQTTAPINPGNSGGPLVNAAGEVIGINSSIVPDAQNIGYAIPVNELKTILADLGHIPLLRKPFLGIVFSSATESLVEYLGNPSPGGCYVVEVVPDSTLDKAGVERGDMIYSLNGYAVDRFGEMNVPWSEDKIGLADLVNRLSIGDTVSSVLYRRGERIECSVIFDYASQPAVRRVYPGYEPIDYEIFGGMVVMELTRNHIEALKERATGLAKYLELRNQAEPVLLVTHIFSNSQLYRSHMFSLGTTLNEVNGMKVCTLADFRNAIQKGAGNPFLTMLASDNVARSSDHIFVALPMQQLLVEETQLSKAFRYPLTALSQELLRVHSANQELAIAAKAPVDGKQESQA